MEEFQGQSPNHIMQAIMDLQENIVAQRDERRQLESRLADINQHIDEDVIALAELQEQLNAAIAAATTRAVTG